MSTETENPKPPERLQSWAALTSLALAPVLCLQTIYTIFGPTNNAIFPIIFVVCYVFILGAILLRQHLRFALNFSVTGVLITIFFVIFISAEKSLPNWQELFPRPAYYISFEVFIDKNGTGRHGKIYDPVKYTKVTIFSQDEYQGIYIRKTDDSGAASFALPRFGKIVVTACGVNENREIGANTSSPGVPEPIQFPVPVSMVEKCDPA